MKRENLVGNKYGQLKVIEILYNYNNTNETMCLCQCVCGTEVIRKAYSSKK